MTTTFPAPATTSVPAPVAAAAPSGCPVAQSALHSAAGDLAEVFTGIAFDAPCRPERQRAVLDFSAGVLRTALGVAARTGDEELRAACDAVSEATPLFAHDISAGAPGLAGAWIALTQVLAQRPVARHEHAPADLLQCERRFRTLVGSASFAVPWFVDACSPRERVALIGAAPWRVRLALRLGEDRWLRLRVAVRGC